MTQTPPLSKKVFRRSFDQAAKQYDEAAVLQHEVGRRLLERLEYFRIQPQCIIDIGCGTGKTSAQLHQFYNKASLIHFDLAHSMVSEAKSKSGWFTRKLGRRHLYLCGDAEKLPLQSQSVDMIFSNLALQWCSDLDQTFAEFRRILKPSGTLLFTSLGPDTLKELRSSWQQADQGAHVHQFLDMHDVGDALLRNGFADPVMDMENITLTYDDVVTLMRDLKIIGAHNASQNRNKGMQGKKAFQSMLQHYEQYRQNGKLPATYEVIYGNAWCANVKDKNPAMDPIPTEQMVKLTPASNTPTKEKSKRD